MDKPDQTPPCRTPPWCCSFENLVVIFSLSPSHTILPNNVLDHQGVPRRPEVPQVHTKHSAHGRGAAGTMISPLPGGQHTLLRAPAPPAWPPRWLQPGCNAEGSVLRSPGMDKDSDLPGSLWLGGGCCFGAAPWSWLGAGAGGVLAGVWAGLQDGGRTVPAEPAKADGVGGPGTEEIACQGLRRAAATRSPLAFSGTATARRRKPPS